MNTQRKQKKNKNARNDTKGKIVTIELVAFVFLAVYLAGYTVSMLRKPKISIETVAYGQIDMPRQFDGLIVRDETVIFSSEPGTAVFSYGEGEYVKKDSIVCAVRDKNSLNILEREIETLSDSIIDQALKSDMPAQTEEINRVNARMKNEIGIAVPMLMSNNGNEVYRLKSQLQKDMETRNGILLAGSSGTLSALVDKKTVFEKRLSDNTGTYRANQGGVLSYNVDGLESELTPENAVNVTVAQVETHPADVFVGGLEVEAGSPLFKIVNSNVWQMCAYLENELVLDWNVGLNKPVYFSDTAETKKVVMRVTDIVQNDEKTLVVFSSSKYLLDFIDKRHVKFSLEDDTYKGLKIPNTAITEKMALLVPAEYIYEYRGSSGVYVKENNGFVFRGVNVLLQRDKMAYVLQNFDNIKLSTEVYRYEGGKAVSDGSFMIKEIMTIPGIYVANSGSAEFRHIELIKRNDFYSIIEKGTGRGVRSFDSIVTDASSVTDNQIIR